MMAASARNNPKKITHYGAKSHADELWVYLMQIISYNLTQMNFLKSHTDLTDLSDKVI